MAAIIKKIPLVGSLGSRLGLAPSDNCITYSLIEPLLSRELSFIEHLPKTFIFGNAHNGDKLFENKSFSFMFYIDDYCFSEEFMFLHKALYFYKNFAHLGVLCGK